MLSPADAILKTTQISMPLKGLAIGNGWIDGRHQYPAYYDFALRSGLIKEGSQVSLSLLIPKEPSCLTHASDRERRSTSAGSLQAITQST